MVRTEPSQGLNTGSTPVSATSFSITLKDFAVTRFNTLQALWPHKVTLFAILAELPRWDGTGVGDSLIIMPAHSQAPSTAET
jgi:hypothetical protein